LWWRSFLTITTSYFYNPSKRNRILRRRRLKDFKPGEILAMDAVWADSTTPENVENVNAHGRFASWNIMRPDGAVSTAESQAALELLVSRSAAGESTWSHSFIRGNPPTWYDRVYPSLAGVPRP
jgi:hypothetical protein